MNRLPTISLGAAVCLLLVPVVSLAQPGLGAPLNSGDLVVTEFSGQFGIVSAVIRVDPISGTQTTIARTDTSALPSVIRGVAVDANGDIFVADVSTPGKIVKVDAATGVVTTFASGGHLQRPVHIVIDKNGDLLVATIGNDAIVRVDPVTAAQTLVTSGGNLVTPTGMVIDSNGDLFVADPALFPQPGKIVRVDLSTGTQTLITASLGETPRGLVIDPSDGFLIVVDGDAPGIGGVFRVNPISGAASTLSSGGIFNNPTAIVTDANGDFLVCDADSPPGGEGAVVTVDRTTGAQATLSNRDSATTEGTPSLFHDPFGLAVATGALAVPIDIKPGSDPNSINLASSGVVPVAILSTATFDASEVDPATVSLAGARVKLVGKSQKLLASLEDINGDGLLDLVCKVETVQFIIEVGDSEAVLEGATFGGQAITGSDSINIVP